MMPITFGKGNGDGHGMPSGPPPDMPVQVIEVAKDFVQEFGPQHDLDPTLFIPQYDPKKGWGIVVSVLEGERDRIAVLARLVLGEFPCPWYVFVMEAWVGKKTSPTGQVSDLPRDDREEWILVTLVEKHKGMSRTETCQVKRFKGRRSLTPWEKKGEYFPVSGLFPIDW